MELYIRVKDVQNTPPVFTTSLVAVVKEDAAIGTRVMTVHARDGDTGEPRAVQYELVTSKCYPIFCPIFYDFFFLFIFV